MFRHPKDPDMRKTMFIIAITAVLFGFLMLFLKTWDVPEAPSQLTAELSQ